jgi:outer membrane protein TolC
MPERSSAQDTGAPLGIRTLVRSALDGNRELQGARETYITAQEQVSEAWSTVMPSVDFNASYQRNISPALNFLPAAIFDPTAGPDDYIGVQFGADNVWNSTISVEQALFRPNVLVALGAARRFEMLQGEAVRGREQAVVTQVRTAYYGLLLAQEQARLTENSVRRVQESLKETKALNRAGLASDYDVLRLEVELANLEPNLRRAGNAVLQARRELAIVANLDDHEGLQVQGALAEINLRDPSANSPANREVLAFAGIAVDGVDDLAAVVDGGMARAVEMRSDLRQLELTEELRNTEMRAEQATYLPEITLFGNYIINAQDNGSPSFFGRGDGQRANSKAVGVRVSLPIFQGFRRDARIDQKRAALRQAQANTSQGVQVAQSQVRTIAESVEEAFLRATGQQLAVGQARRGFEIASAQYSEGISGQLELTDSEVALRQSEFNYAQAVYDYLVARARLDEAVGQVPLVDVNRAERGEDR